VTQQGRLERVSLASQPLIVTHVCIQDHIQDSLAPAIQVVVIAQ